MRNLSGLTSSGPHLVPFGDFLVLYADPPLAARLTLTFGSGAPVYLLPMQDDIDHPGRFKFLDWCLLAGALGAMGVVLVLLAQVVAD